MKPSISPLETVWGYLAAVVIGALSGLVFGAWLLAGVA